MINVGCDKHTSLRTEPLLRSKQARTKLTSHLARFIKVFLISLTCCLSFQVFSLSFLLVLWKNSWSTFDSVFTSSLLLPTQPLPTDHAAVCHFLNMLVLLSLFQDFPISARNAGRLCHWQQLQLEPDQSHLPTQHPRWDTGPGLRLHLC